MPNRNKRLSLNGQWSVRSVFNDVLQNKNEFKQLSFPGSVPGSTLNDLIHAQITCKDIFWRSNAETVQTYENYNWHYTKDFVVDTRPEGKATLVFERLDTYCDIYLNGVHLGFFDNGYITHRMDVSEVLLVGQNRLEVFFYSPINYTLGKHPLPAAFTAERLYNRRIQCTYGWDWTMRFVTTGIYGDCYIEFAESRPAVRDVYIYTKTADDESASVGIDIELAADSAAGVLTFCLISPNGQIVNRYSRFCKESFSRFTLDLPAPQLWYPLGYGEQPLYTLSVLFDGMEIYSETFGIRTIQIMRLPDQAGSRNHIRCLELKETAFSQYYDQNELFSGFILKVNGIKILCKGANWVPCSPFETEGMEEKITRILTLSAAAGVNMIRVWGGGYVEKHHFYNECSRLGILVIHDFFMACGTYPEKEEWFIRQLNREAEFTVRYLRNQPCLAWWHGDNENAVNGSDTDIDYSGRDSAYRGLAPYVWQLDPYREFLPSSPWGGQKNASNTVGTTHNTQFLGFIFQYLDTHPFDDYKEYIGSLNARFISEDPIFGASSLESLRKMMSEDDIFGDDLQMWKYHTQSNPGLSKHLLDYYLDMAQKVLGRFTDGHDRLFKLQYIQCELVRLSLERVRREKWFSAGNLFWMLSDCWPAAAGWAIIDYYGMPKPAYYAFKRSAAPIIPVLSAKDGALSLTVSNDTTEDIGFNYRITEIVNGKTVNQSDFSALTAMANESAVIAEIPLPADEEMVVADVEVNGVLSRTFYKKGALQIAKADADAFSMEYDTDRMTITANTYLQSVGIECLNSDALLSDNYFAMLPGEQKTVRISDSAHNPGSASKNKETFQADVIAYRLI